MIQTQLLRLDPPYQIIAAGGMVGIQMATLIVTEDKTGRDGVYAIDTHSHPVVSYSQKHGLEDVGNLSNKSIRLEPEGAVWNKIEVRDIRVLGLAGRYNEKLTMEEFLSLVPTDPQYRPFERVWNDDSLAKMYNMQFGIEQVGLKFQEASSVLRKDKDGNVIITLQLDAPGNSTPLVLVRLGKDDYYMSNAFNICLVDEKGTIQIDLCLKRIIHAVSILHHIFFLKKEKIKFYHDGIDYEKKDLESVVANLTKYANAEYR